MVVYESKAINNLPHQTNNHNAEYIMTVKITYPSGAMKIEGDITEVNTNKTRTVPSDKFKAD